MRSLSFSGVKDCSIRSWKDTSDDLQEVSALPQSVAGVSGTGMASLDAGGAEFQPFLALNFPLVQEGTVVRDVTLSTKLKI